MSPVHRLLLYAAVTAAGVAACGYPDFQFSSYAGGSTAAPAGTGGDGGAGGVVLVAGGGSGPLGGHGGSAGSTTTSDGANGGNGGSGGGAGSGGGGPLCLLGTPTGCPASQKCSVVEPTTGEIDCVTAGSRPDWSKCMQDADCGVGSYCEGYTGVCKPVCDGADSCLTHAEAQCVQALAAGGQPVVGLTVCTAHCNPIQTPPCDGTHGAVTCGYRAGVGALDCYASMNVQVGDNCSSDSDCAPGLACTGECREWCKPPGWNNGCGVIEDCDDRNPPVFYEGNEYGVCDPW
jgi:hypothetical protein